MKKIPVLTILLLFSCSIQASEYTPCTNSETAANTCFDCGQNCVARVSYENVVQADGSNKQIGTMVISGTGNMGGWGAKSEPWWDIRNSIHNLTVEEGITSVGYNAFYRFDQLAHVDLPQSLQTIEPGGFEYCYALTNLDLPEGVALKAESLESSGITSIIIPETSTVDPRTFKADNPGDMPITNIYCSQSNISQCREAVAYRGDNVNVVQYEKTSDGQYRMGGLFYQNPSDILSGAHIKKRIYTVDEANSVSGKTNKVKVRYK